MCTSSWPRLMNLYRVFDVAAAFDALNTQFPRKTPKRPSKLSPTLTACAKTFFIISTDSAVIRLNSLTFDRKSQQSTVSVFQCFSAQWLRFCSRFWGRISIKDELNRNCIRY